jgi:hypothetical protein
MSEQQRGSERILGAWKARALTEEAVQEIAKAFEASPAKVTGASVDGGAAPTRLSVSLTYEGDDVPRCGNDILFWLKWHRTFGGEVKPPRIIINGTPFPDLVRLELDFGHSTNPSGGLGEIVGGPAPGATNV